MDENTDDVGQAVAGFRRAEVALAAIAADADRLVDARSEVEQARNELKVVAGALVGLATAHRDLVGQLGEAAAALRPVERKDDERLAVALRESEVVRSRQTAEMTDAVEQLAHRLDRALSERIGGVVDQMNVTVGGLARADQVKALDERLDHLDQVAGRPTDPGEYPGLIQRLDVIDRLPDAQQLAAIQDLLAALTSAADTGRLDHLTTNSDLDALEQRLVERLSEAKAPAPAAAEKDVAEQAATTAALAVEEQVAELIEHVHAGQRRVHQLVLAVGVSFLLFAALMSILALR